MTDIVPFDASHVPSFTAWFNALPNNNIWTEEWIRFKSIEDDAYDPALMIAAEERGSSVGFLLGSIANATGWVRAFLVHPEHRRKGIGTAMFQAVERAFAERGIADIIVGWAPPRYLLPGVDIAYTSAIVFLDRQGYQTTRETRVNMDVLIQGQDLDTTAREGQLFQHGIAVRRARDADQAGIVELCSAYNHTGWIVEAAMALVKDPIPLFVAEREGRICGFAAHSVSGPAYFGPMLTATELRGMGIGSVLLKRCLLDWQRAGLARCEISWTGPISFYARTVGATMGRAFWVWHKSGQPS